MVSVAACSESDAADDHQEEQDSHLMAFACIRGHRFNADGLAEDVIPLAHGT
jgi:hypothetical protein